MMKKWIFLLVTAFAFVNCEDVVDIDLDTADARLVIDARLELLENGDSRSTVKLTRTAGFFEEENPLVLDAQVFVTDGNGVNYPFMYNQSQQLYESRTLVIADELNYTLTVIDQGFTYTATQQLVRTVPLTDVSQEEVTAFDDITEIRSFFTDPPELGNNYLFTYEDEFNFEVDISDDEFINGNKTPNTFFVEELEPGTNIQLTIAGIDARTFRYFETLLQQTDAGGGGPFGTQPATVRGNIVNETDREQFAFGYFRVSQVFVVNYVSVEN